jgi:hypothetical protein
MAIDIDGVSPLWAACRVISEPVVRLKSMTVKTEAFTDNFLAKYRDNSSRSSSGVLHGCGVGSGVFSIEEMQCCSLDQVLDKINQAHLSPACVLLRACLLVSGVLALATASECSASLGDSLQSLYGGGIELTSCSLIPSGSGMGGSSILAAVVLKALMHRLAPASAIENGYLVDMVSKSGITVILQYIANSTITVVQLLQ